jgi:DNA polymerase family A
MDVAGLRQLYTQVICIDFEFYQPDGERPLPLCMATHELFSGQSQATWLLDAAPSGPAWPCTPNILVVGFYASAELSCYLAQGWEFPQRLVDVYAEFRCLSSGLTVPAGHGLLGALEACGLPSMASAEKIRMQHLARRGPPFTAQEREALLLYCRTDVEALARLFHTLLPALDFKRALLRGRFLSAAARIEWEGIPCDAETLEVLRRHWDTVRGKLVQAVNQHYHVFVPQRLTLDPATPLGRQVLALAAAYDLDPYAVAHAADQLWREQRDLYQETVQVRRTARQRTGLTPTAIDRWERAGYDAARWPHLDAMAQELAGEFPTLGIGVVEDADEGIDYGGRLWDLLHTDEDPRPRRDDPQLLQRAVHLVQQDPEGWLGVGPLRFATERFEAYLVRQQIPWPRLASGQLDLSDQVFREMARAHPEELGPLRELRYALSQLRLHALAVGRDGKNRCLLSVFGSRTGRNQPSNSKYIFGPSCWLRSLIKPAPGRAVAYCDWHAQELAIAAYLSGDSVLQDCYQSGDPYLMFARLAGAVPAEATKASHPQIRAQYKTVMLGIMYGQSEVGIARRLSMPLCDGRRLLQQHKRLFRQFWHWSELVEIEGMLGGRLHTCFGWQVHAGDNPNPRSLRNFPMQATGAEMMRLACCLATERGLAVCGVVHDALLVEASIDAIDDVTARTQAAMEDASTLVLPGWVVRTDRTIVRWPDRFEDERGAQMWALTQRLLTEIQDEVPF